MKLMKEIVPGIYFFRVPLFEQHVQCNRAATLNVYLLRGRDGYMMIDSGWNTELCWNSLEQQLAGMGVRWGDIRKVVYTHLHEDHCGLMGLLKEVGVGQLVAHRRDIAWLKTKYALSDEAVWQEEGVWFHRLGLPPEQLDTMRETAPYLRQTVQWPLPEIALEGGETIEFPPFQLKVFWTPGHNPGHICLYEPRLKLLFSGDHIPDKFAPVICLFRFSEPGYNPLGEYLNSLKSTKSVDAIQVLPGHGSSFDDPDVKIDRTISVIKQSVTHLLDTMDGQTLTGFDVALQLNHGPSWSGLYTYDKRQLFLEAAAMLQALKLDGRVEAVSCDGVDLFKHIAPDVKS